MTTMPASTLDFVLPGEWWRVPLDEGDAAIAKSAAALASMAYGKSDEVAQQRADVRAQVCEAAEAARRTGGSQLHIALRIIGEIPLPAALTVVWPEFAVSADPARALDELLSSLPTTKTPTVLVEHQMPTVRSVATTAGAPDAGVLPRLEVNYWMVTALGRLVVFTFSSVLVEYQDSMVELFDAIVGTVRVRTDTTDSGSEEQ